MIMVTVTRRSIWHEIMIMHSHHDRFYFSAFLNRPHHGHGGMPTQTLHYVDLLRNNNTHLEYLKILS